MAVHIYSGQLLDMVDDPYVHGEAAVRFEKCGAFAVCEGKIVARGSLPNVMAQCQASYNHAVIKHTDFGNALITPGFIDTHVHYPQLEMMASYGEQLLGWLNNHTFPVEAKFSDKAYAKVIAQQFVRELLKNGTTTAAVFCTVHPQSVDAFFEEAEKYDLRMIAGKVMMDRNCPDNLQDTPTSSYEQSQTLIDQWHNKGRLLYAVTPRFAPTSSPEQLAQCAGLLDDNPGVYLHTHTSENQDECDWVSSLFPDDQDYVGVYESAGLLRHKTILAHGVHVCERELKVISSAGAGIAHCPMSNLFMGSGLFNYVQAKAHNVNVSMGTDIGGGTRLSMFQAYHEAYKVQQLQGYSLSAYEGLYLNTLGGARALSLEGTIGQLEVGCEADFVVIDANSTELMAMRTRKEQSLHDWLFGLMMLADERSIAFTYAHGQCVYERGV